MTNVTKNLAGVEDLLLGITPTVQTRAGTEYVMTPVSAYSLPFGAAAGPTIAKMICPEVVAFTGEIEFDKPNIYGSSTPLTTSTLLANPVNWVPGVEVTIFHEAEEAPTFNVTGGGYPWVKQGSNNYIPDTVNMIIARYLYGNRIDYVVVPAGGMA